MDRCKPVYPPLFQSGGINGCGDIFDEKFGKKEKGINKRKNKQEKAHFQSHDTTCGCGPVYQI